MGRLESEERDRAAVIRRQAEHVVHERSLLAPDANTARSREQMYELLHELEVHQVELEMQNQELRRTQLELDAARARYFDLYDQAPVGYITLDDGALIANANLGAEHALGVGRSLLNKQRIEAFIFPDDQDTYYFARKKLAETGLPQMCELRMVHRTSGSFWAQLRSSAAHEDGKRTSRIVILDIDERKRAEGARQKLQEELSRAQRLESVGRLAGGVAHDFNNMLMVILTHVGFALEGLSEEHPVRAELAEIEKAAQRASELTRQLLSYASRQLISPEALNLSETITEVLGMLRRVVSSDIELDWKPAPDLWLVKLDRTQLDQILINLCINASAAITGCGAIVIEATNCSLDEDACAGRAHAKPGEYVCLTVADTGHGMDEETLSHVFEPFFTTRKFGAGTGLGLATVYGALQQNHGFIEVQSAKGSGTKFTLYLPRYQGEVSAASSKRRSHQVHGGNETLLLVEDEPALLAATKSLLSRQGYNVLAATNPSQALELAAKHAAEIDLLVTDVVMPEMNGVDLGKALRALNPALKCLFVSGYDAELISRRGILEPGASFAQKPLIAEELATKVREALDQRPR